MKISERILYEELGKIYAVEAFGEISCGLSLGNVMFLRAGGTPEAGRIWIADKDARNTAEAIAEGLAADAAEAAEAAGTADEAEEADATEESGGMETDGGTEGAEAVREAGRIPGAVVTKDTDAATPLAEIFESALLVKGKVSTSKIHGAIQDIFTKYDIWDAELHRVLTSSSDIQALIDVGTRIFGNPLILHDVNFKVTAASSEFSDAPALIPLLNEEKLPFLMNSVRDRSVVGTTSGNIMYLRANDMPGVSANLFRRGKFKYRLMLLELKREIQPHESALLEYLADYVRLALGLVTGESAVSLSVTGFMANILSGEINSREYIEEQMPGFGWRPDDEFVIYRVFTYMHEKNDRTLGFMTTRIADLFDEQCVFEHDDSIVAVFNLTARGGGDVPVDVAMADFLRDNNLTGGKSDVFTGFGHVLQHYAQAGIANKLRPKVKQYDHLCMFRDVVEQYLLETCTETMPASMVCAPELLRLKAYDEKHQTEFYHTLSVYLKSDLHSVKAAKDLFVARSTFIYRIERIQALTGLDFNKLGDKWYLLLSLELIEQADKDKRDSLRRLNP
ncbi:MAG: helix-turn-helix domain-containing protein [Clostridiales Family XIII bacterium]|jgi:hypothetical protein|nr:helix-turn-helix domain-containing protein [Clostridiales Family XIII bacterium]